MYHSLDFIFTEKLLEFIPLRGPDNEKMPDMA
jgi:hypothetical protein